MSLTKANNPLRLVYDALWAMLRQDADFVAEFPASHCIEYGGTALFEPERRGVMGPSDFPQCAVKLTAMLTEINNTSNSSFLHTAWEIEVSTGDRQQTTLMDAAWIIYKATTNWTAKIRDAASCVWQGEPFVHKCQPLEVAFDDGNRELNKGTKGWSCVWKGRVDLHFTTSDLDTA